MPSLRKTISKNFPLGSSHHQPKDPEEKAKKKEEKLKKKEEKQRLKEEKQKHKEEEKQKHKEEKHKNKEEKLKSIGEKTTEEAEEKDRSQSPLRSQKSESTLLSLGSQPKAPSSKSTASRKSEVLPPKSRSFDEESVKRASLPKLLWNTSKGSDPNIASTKDGSSRGFSFDEDDSEDYSSSGGGNDPNVITEQSNRAIEPHRGSNNRPLKRGSLGHVATNVSTAMVGTALLPVVAGKAVFQGSVKAVQASANAAQNAVDHGISAATKAVDAGTQAVTAGTQALTAGTQVVTQGVTQGVTAGANTVVSGGKAIVSGGKAIAGSTTQVVEASGKAVFKGTRGMAKGMKSALNLGKYSNVRRNPEAKKSKWEQGVEVIESLLEPGSDTYEAMTPEQRKKLQSVKKLLITGPSGGGKIAHIPRDLIKMKNSTSTHFSVGGKERRLSSNFILQEFAGVNKDTTILGQGSDLDMSDTDEEDSADEIARVPHRPRSKSPVPEPGRKMKRRGSGESFASLGSLQKSLDDGAENIVDFVPTEFKVLSQEDQMVVYNMLKWDNLRKWDFNIFDLNEFTKGNPLLFVGWAILGSPYAQNAMANEIGIEPEPGEGYPFMDELLIPPRKLCEYLRVIESDYHAANPYHNAIHAADVMQSLNTLIQKSIDEEFLNDCPDINLFTILLAAAIHDVDHPGKTNAFYTSMRTELAVMYNDRSVLENWHVAHAFARMLGLELTGSHDIHASQVITAKKNEDQKACDTNILCNASPEQFKTIRNLMIEAVLHTDMTKHFEMVNSAKGLLRQAVNEENTWKVLMFMLHMADISGQAKPDPLFKLWTQRCMNEFFAQGDEEATLGLPISPNCDRTTTDPAESQVGFIKFVVEPAYEVLGQFVPFVDTKVLPIIHENLDHWIREVSDEDESHTGMGESSRRSVMFKDDDDDEDEDDEVPAEHITVPCKDETEQPENGEASGNQVPIKV